MRSATMPIKPSLRRNWLCRGKAGGYAPRMGRIHTTLLAIALAAGLPAALHAQAAGPPAPRTELEELAGLYSGHQAEVATMLELQSGGRFRYALSYGALDEVGQGSWTYEAGKVLLTSDATIPPEFELVSERAGEAGELALSLEVPEGLSPQFFSAAVTFADGTAFERQLGEEGLTVPFAPAKRPVSVALRLHVYGLSSQPVRIKATGGAALHFRFVPNDLGRVAFANVPLAVKDGQLLLERHGLNLRFRRVGAE